MAMVVLVELVGRDLAVMELVELVGRDLAVMVLELAAKDLAKDLAASNPLFWLLGNIRNPLEQRGKWSHLDSTCFPCTRRLFQDT
jgi:hypothetical protein